jgi:hypothetical protein
MKNLERKIDMLIALAVAEDETSRMKAIEDLKSVSQEPSINADEVADARATHEIESILREIGVPCSLTGYYDMIIALKLVLDDPSYVQGITKRLYGDVAKIQGPSRTPCRVERAIRHAIENAWDRGDMNVLKNYFGNTVSSMKGKPTNSEFLSQMAIHLRNRLNGIE